jgi:hypothetical protein
VSRTIQAKELVFDEGLFDENCGTTAFYHEVTFVFLNSRIFQLGVRHQPITYERWSAFTSFSGKAILVGTAFGG